MLSLLCMKQPDDTIIGGSRKTLPTRKTRTVQKAAPSAGKKRNPTQRKKNILDKDVEKELVRVFGER